jgi:hypothetical protein
MPPIPHHGATQTPRGRAGRKGAILTIEKEGPAGANWHPPVSAGVNRLHGLGRCMPALAGTPGCTNALLQQQTSGVGPATRWRRGIATASDETPGRAGCLLLSFARVR